jgi:ribose 5-phosphate isomerase B
MKIGLACDHGGYSLKDPVKETIARSGHEVVDLGTHSTDSVDYPDYAGKAIDLLKKGGCERIVLICGTGIGMSICANRVKGVRGTLCHDAFTARMARQHNDSNCLILGARVIGSGVAQDIVEVWLATEFEGGRHLSRLNKIDELA